ncbi:hypothetical protein HYQ45_012469 [Verticillium longisporum]|uniref:Uncharacterized protein n=1 Tax=Verticillium longisporum TaxID=100787 RepID=A0A8I3AMU2_VERLO|nr:hypothetical protein HYQ45_012469 [Verticillium longisporum]
MEDVSWKIENLFDEETEIQCLDEWNDYHKCIFPSEVRFLHHLPPMVAVFDREDKIRAFRQKARIPEKAKLAARWRIQNKIAIPTSESWVHRAIDGTDTMHIRKHPHNHASLLKVNSITNTLLKHHQPDSPRVMLSADISGYGWGR